MMKIKARVYIKRHNGFHYSDDAGFDALFDWAERYGGVVELFTGIKDKKGTDIYGGDFINEGRSGPCLIVWDDKQAKFVYRTKTSTIGMFSFYGEIIGNVHENPDILVK